MRVKIKCQRYSIHYFVDAYSTSIAHTFRDEGEYELGEYEIPLCESSILNLKNVVIENMTYKILNEGYDITNGCWVLLCGGEQEDKEKSNQSYNKAKEKLEKTIKETKIKKWYKWWR